MQDDVIDDDGDDTAAGGEFATQVGGSHIYGVIDLFHGACAVKGNVQVAGHVKRVDHGAVF